MDEPEPRERLRQLRVQSGLSQERLAQQIRVSPSTVGKWERGEQTPRPGRRPSLARTLGVPDPILAAALDGEDDGASTGVPEWLGSLAGFEARARAVQSFESFTIPGLLQTEDYARAVESSVADENLTDRDIERRVANRLRRQMVLRRSPDPLHLSVVIDESVILRSVGDRLVMRDQIDHLISQVACPNVEIRLLPLTAKAFAAVGPFMLFFTVGRTPDMASAMERAEPHYLFRRPDVDAHQHLFDYLTSRSLCPDETQARLAVLCKELYS